MKCRPKINFPLVQTDHVIIGLTQKHNEDIHMTSESVWGGSKRIMGNLVKQWGLGLGQDTKNDTPSPTTTTFPSLCLFLGQITSWSVAAYSSTSNYFTIYRAGIKKRGPRVSDTICERALKMQQILGPTESVQVKAENMCKWVPLNLLCAEILFFLKICGTGHYASLNSYSNWSAVQLAGKLITK